MEEEPATITFSSAGKQQPQTSAGTSPSVKFSSQSVKMATLTAPMVQKRRSGGLERCAVSFATAAIRLNDLLSAEAEDASNLGTCKDSDDNLSQSSVLTAASEPSLPIKTSGSDRRLDSMETECGLSEGGSKWSFRSVESHLGAGSPSVRKKGTPVASDRESIDSTDSKGERSKLASILDRARLKGKKLVSSSRKRRSGEEVCQETILSSDESGKKALVVDAHTALETEKRAEKSAAAVGGTMPSSLQSCVNWHEASRQDLAGTPLLDVASSQQPQLLLRYLTQRFVQLPLIRQRLVLLVALVAVTFVSPGFFSGLLWGLYLSFLGFLYFFVSEPQQRRASVTTHASAVMTSNDIIFSISEELQQRKTAKNIVYKGWMNELRERYDPATYHVNQCQTVLIRLDGQLLRISRPERNVLKHAFHTDRTLSEPEPTICGQSIFDLTDAVVSLRPKRLARRRWWSRKYPIHIRLARRESEVISDVFCSNINSNDTVNNKYLSNIKYNNMQRSQSAVGGSKRNLSELVRRDSVESTTCRDRTVGLGDSSENEMPESYLSGEESSSEGEAIDVCQSMQARGRPTRATSVGNIVVGQAPPPSEGAGLGTCPDSCRPKLRGRSLYLFVRSAREKERWFHRLREACSQYRRQPSYASNAAHVRDASPLNRPSSASQHENETHATAAAAAAAAPNRDAMGGGVGAVPVPGVPSTSHSPTATPSSSPLPNRGAATVSSCHAENQATFASGPARRLSLPSVRQRSALAAVNLEYLQYVSTHVQFQKNMCELFQNVAQQHDINVNNNVNNTNNNGIIFMDLGRNKWKPGTANRDAALVLSANAVASRIFYDFCRDAYWCKQVQEKIQSKLATINLPYFIETLELSSLDFGTVTPQIFSVYPPILDDWGLWVDFELKYHGGIHLVLETRVNLMKLKCGQQKVETEKKISRITSSERAHHYSDEDLPESPESSPDEDFGSKMEKSSTTRERTGKKILSMVDKIASSKYFQGASELKPVKKMMEEISSTRLMLNVEVTLLEGPMTINIPPPPSDRLWYAFRRPPKISIRAVPQVGDRSVDMGTVSDWIENRLRLLLEKNLVCPNMDDVVVPVMSGNELLRGGYNR